MSGKFSKNRTVTPPTKNIVFKQTFGCLTQRWDWGKESRFFSFLNLNKVRNVCQGNFLLLTCILHVNSRNSWRWSFPRSRHEPKILGIWKLRLKCHRVNIIADMFIFFIYSFLCVFYFLLFKHHNYKVVHDLISVL